MNELFNRNLVFSRKEKLSENIKESEILKYISENLTERVSSIEGNFQNIANISNYMPFAEEYLRKSYPDSSIKNIKDERNIKDLNQKFDLIVYCYGLHWINDVVGFLEKIYGLLSEKGLFICNFAGGDSLKNLRNFFIESESKDSSRHFPHISPFIKFEQITELVKRAGFNEIVADYEYIELEYPSPMALATAIKNIGESNALVNIDNYQISKKVLSDLKKSDEIFYDKINLVSFVASKNRGSLKVKF